MNKISAFISFLKQNQVAPAENLDQILKLIASDQLVSFFSWKMFEIQLATPPLYDLEFDVKQAQKFISRELKFLNLITTLKINFNYLKLIPDEIPEFILGQSPPPSSNTFATQVQSFFSRYSSNTTCIKVTDLLANPSYKRLYTSTFTRVQNNFAALVTPEKFLKEANIRKALYQIADADLAKTLARRTFSLFAAETALLFRLQADNLLPNPILLAGKRSIDTYKYEFLKRPASRPLLPKLFVL